MRFFLNYHSFINRKSFFNVLNLLKVYGKFVDYEFISDCWTSTHRRSKFEI